MASIGDVFLSLMLDDVRFQKEVVKAGAKGGDAAGQAMASKLGSRVRTAVATGLGAVGGAALSTAASLGAELDAATRTFQAEVGATAEEAAQAQRTLGDLYRSNLVSFEQASGTLAALRTDLNLTQEEADAAAQSFVAFATVTGQDGADAVRAMDEVLDSWGLTAASAQEIMDKLVVSHQKFGGSIQDNEKTLAALAPAMRAANMEVDDGIALLNLFGAKGLDANVASAAFAKALTKVKSPDELQALIADISATEDPFLRAEKAAGLFGARAGAKLANALGGVNLDDYIIGLEEAAGATEKADATLKSAFGTQVQLAIRNVGGAIAQAAQGFGPLLLGFAQLGGPQMTRRVGAGIGALIGNLGSRIAGGLGTSLAGASAPIATGISTALAKAGLSSKLTSATSKLGNVLGTGLGKGLALGFAAIAVVGVFETWSQIKGQLEGQTAEVAASAGKQIATGTLEELRKGRAAVAQGLKDLSGVWDLGIFTTGTRQELERQLAAYDAAIAEKSRAAGLGGAEATAQGMADGAPAVAGAVDDLVDEAAGSLDELPDEAADAGNATALALAEGILTEQSEVDAAFAALTEQAESELTKTAEVAKLIGILTSKELADGLVDGRPGVQAQAENTRKVAEDRLAELGVRPGIYGKKAAQALADGLKSKEPDVRAQAERTKGIVDIALSGVSAKARTAGETTATDYAKGLDAGRDDVDESARALARTVTRAFAPIIRNGFVIQVRAPTTAGNTDNRQHGGPVTPGRSYVVGERQPELFVPNVPGRIVPQVGMGGAPALAGSTVNVDVQVQGLLRARDPFEVATQLRRLADFGVLTPRREPA